MSPFLRRHGVRVLVYGGLLAGLALAWRGRHRVVRLYQTGEWRSRSVGDVLAFAEPRARAAFGPRLEAAGLSWPPEELTLLAFKREARLEVWTRHGARPVFLGALPILAASGKLGPKRRSGDSQVPEGIYALPTLNPMSQFHLSIRVDYPSAEDRAALGDGALGDDIYVHGKAASIGCIAIGDAAIEEVFALAARVPEAHRRIVIAPVDWRREPGWKPDFPAEPWLLERYARLREEVLRHPAEG